MHFHFAVSVFKMESFVMEEIKGVGLATWVTDPDLFLFFLSFFIQKYYRREV